MKTAGMPWWRTPCRIPQKAKAFRAPLNLADGTSCWRLGPDPIWDGKFSLRRRRPRKFQTGCSKARAILTLFKEAGRLRGCQACAVEWFQRSRGAGPCHPQNSRGIASNGAWTLGLDFARRILAKNRLDEDWLKKSAG